MLSQETHFTPAVPPVPDGWSATLPYKIREEFLQLRVAFCAARPCDMCFIQSISLTVTVRRGRVRSLFRFEIGPSFKVGNKPQLVRLPSQLLLS